MYVNTLITLQENLATYAVEGKKVTGHVTIDSPGMIKCYIQNLKKQDSDNQYAFYAFSKAKNKGVRIGGLSAQKETKWVVSEKNVANSGLRLEDLDGVAIVAENGMRGNDTIAMGFKSSKYMIIPLIDEIAKSRSSIKGNQNAVKPDKVNEGKSPILNSTQTNTSNPMPAKTGNTTTTSNNPMPIQTGNTTTTSNPMPTQTGNTVNISSSMPTQVGDTLSSGQAIENGGVLGAFDISMSASNTPTSDNQTNSNNQFSSNVNNNNQAATNEGIGTDEFTKQPILSDEFEEFTNVENIEDDDSELKKIAEKLQEVEKAPSIQKEVNSGVSYGTSIASPSSVVREDDMSEDTQGYKNEEVDVLEKTSKELQQIIARLQEDADIKKKILEIEKQIASISQEEQETEQNQEMRSYNKANIEKTLEARYVSKQIKDDTRDNTIDDLEQNEVASEMTQADDIKGIDTCPRNALAFIKAFLEKAMPQKSQSNDDVQKDVISSHESIQEEIDYISEIDRKIKEIEERRKQDKTMN